MRKLICETLEDYFFGLSHTNKEEAAKQYIKAFENEYNRIKKDYKPNIENDRVIMSHLYADDYLKAYSYFLYLMHKDDGKIFVIDNKLAEALYNTDATFFPNEIRFPFNTFILYINNSTIKSIGKIVGDEWIPEEYNIQYIMVNKLEFEHSNYITFMLGFLDEGESPNNIKAWNNTTLFNLYFPKNEKIKVRGGELIHSYPVGKKLTNEQMELLADSTEGIINFLFNFALYITEVPDDIDIYNPQLIDVSKRKTKSKIEQAIKQNEKESKYIIHYIGKKYRGSYQKSEEITRNNLKTRILVRGHWRMQWYGEKTNSQPGKYQKRIWIEPFWKGPEESKERDEIFVVR